MLLHWSLASIAVTSRQILRQSGIGWHPMHCDNAAADMRFWHLTASGSNVTINAGRSGCRACSAGCDCYTDHHLKASTVAVKMWSDRALFSWCTAFVADSPGACWCCPLCGLAGAEGEKHVSPVHSLKSELILCRSLLLSNSTRALCCLQGESPPVQRRVIKLL